MLKLLLKPYADDFVVAPPKSASFGNVFDQLVVQLAASIQAQRDALSARTGDLPTGPGNKVHALGVPAGSR